MKKELLVLAIVGIIGQATMLYALLFVAHNNDQIILSTYLFILFGIIGTASIVINDKIEKNENKTTE